MGAVEPVVFTAIFIVAWAASLALRLWLARRQVAHVAAHRDRVPSAFSDSIALAGHHKAADYTVAKQHLGMVETVADAAILIAMTLGGGLALLLRWTEALPMWPIWRDIALLAGVALIGGVISLPFSWYRTFRLEARFGFNRTTLRLWLTDLAKGLLVGVALGLPLTLAILWLMGRAGSLWWLWAWLVWFGFQVLMLFLYPTVIAPMFNRFTPLPAGAARERIVRLLARCGFHVAGLFVMDGSRRSGHGNAYFTGFGKARRIVFFDTLLTRLVPDEIEAILAHELGHYKLRHVLKRIVWSALFSLAFLALLAWLAATDWFYAGLGIPPSLLPVAHARPGVAIALFLLALPVFVFILSPLAARYSRRHEFEADAFAARNASATALVSALVKLYEDNAATLTPDPVHSAFYDSHPPASIRVARLQQAAA
jgi:STE24 endopeptidase